ncbi:MAG TPA: hypothetical protein VHQ66_00855, partial [Myxococcota bacterium]|nr:hypothetical protein [Myxococcota bacterium]
MAAAGPGLRAYAALAVAFAALSAQVYAPALPGAFISDDLTYVALNPYVQAVSLRNVVAILDPLGDM